MSKGSKANNQIRRGVHERVEQPDVKTLGRDGVKAAPSPRHRLTEAERARVCEILNEFRVNPVPVLQRAKRLINGDRRAFLLTDEDKEDVLAEYTLRVHRYRDRILSAANPWAYMKTMVRRTVFDHLRRRRYELRVVIRRRARVNQLLEQLRLNNAQFKSDSWNELGNRVLVMSTTASQARDLRHDPRVASLVVLHDGLYSTSVDDVPPPDPSNAALGWQVREDLETVHRVLKHDMPVPAEVFDLRMLEELDWKTVAAKAGFTERHCRELLKQYFRRMLERFPEMRDYLGDFGRNQA